MNINRNTKNLGYLFFVEFAVRLLAFFAFAYLARVLGKSNFGVISIGLAILSYGLIISNSGLSMLAVRKVAAGYKPIEELTARIFVLRLTLTVLVMGTAGILISLFIGSAKIVEVSLLYLLYMLPAAFLLEWYFQGRQNMGNIVWGRILAMLSYLIFILAFVKSGSDILYTPIGWSLSLIVNAIFLFFVFKKQNNSILAHLKNLKLYALLKETIPFASASIIAEIVSKFPVIYLGFALSTSEAGSFSAAFRIIVFLLALDRIFVTLFYPKIVSVINNSFSQLSEIFNAVLKLIVSVSILIGVMSILLSDILVEVIVGSAYSSAVPILQILVGFFTLTLINSVFTYTIIGMNKERIYTTALAVSAVFFFIGAIILTKILGGAGTAATLVLFELTVVSMLYHFLRKNIPIKIGRFVVIPILSASAIVILFLFVLEFNFYFEVAIAFLLTIIVIVAGIGFGKKDIEFLTRILK